MKPTDADGDGDGGDDGDGGEAPLLRPIRDEQRARAKMAELIGAHLARYATTAEEDERAMARGAEGDDEEAVLALRFAHFEKALLSDALAALRAAMGDSPPESLSYVVAGAKGRHLERSYFAHA